MMPYEQRPLKRLCFLPALAAQLRAAATPVIVTGATGWLGQATLEMLDSALGDGLQTHVTAFATTPKALTLRSGRTLMAQAFPALAQQPRPPSLIFHFAFRTRGHAREPHYIATNRAITRTMLDFITTNGALGLMIPSSGAIYGPNGAPDTNLANNAYGVLKHEDETIFQQTATQIGIPTAIPRIFNLAGPFINNPAAYALSCIIADIFTGRPITLHAPHPVWRSYTHIEDMLNIATTIMLRAIDAPVFDTAGDPEIEISTLAARTSQLLANRSTPIIRPNWQAGTPSNYLGDIAQYRNIAALTGVALQSLDSQIIDTADYLKEQESSFCEQKEAKKL